MRLVKGKTKKEHLNSAAKYVIPASTASWAITEIIAFMFPALQAIKEPIMVVVTIIVNLAIVYLVK